MSSKPTITSSRPYLIRALYDWIVDNGLTPYLLVNAQNPTVDVPAQFVQDGKIVLNVSPTAVRALELGNEHIAFGARFGGTPTEVLIPSNAVLAIYARENGQGMAFHAQADDNPPGPPAPDKPARPNLKVVK